ncbi:gephyrin-like molybdotransferase receptor GlpR [Amycolatopsis sp. GM8]|uniref:divisome protein SepX/GlpR n=1 Tax=Amycolatopsis sp. GM8 TaxID=2896530 RepID=UPI001F422FB9|nr:gephyrin-like molybdotransferase receptor GlpR [Amycolatopsis sp. GM8]
MPSSLIIVALAAAWLVVLVPMVARKRQSVAKTTDAALAARVVRSGTGGETAEAAPEVAEPELDETEDDEREYRQARFEAEEDEGRPSRRGGFEDPDDRYEADSRQYRPGRGGFDPEAAEIAARAKYAMRQRVVVGLILLAVVSAVAAVLLSPLLWWGHGAVDVAFVSYLAYLRRQVRIENEIRQRRLARLDRARRRPMPRREPVRDEYETPEEPRRELVGIERRPSPASRLRGNAVVIDVDDEDPAFHELDDPGQLPFRWAVGE